MAKEDVDLLLLGMKTRLPPKQLHELMNIMTLAEVETAMRRYLRYLESLPRAKPKPTAVNQSAINRLKQLGHK